MFISGVTNCTLYAGTFYVVPHDDQCKKKKYLIIVIFIEEMNVSIWFSSIGYSFSLFSYIQLIISFQNGSTSIKSSTRPDTSLSNQMSPQLMLMVGTLLFLLNYHSKTDPAYFTEYGSTSQSNIYRTLILALESSIGQKNNGGSGVLGRSQWKGCTGKELKTLFSSKNWIRRWRKS